MAGGTIVTDLRLLHWPEQDRASFAHFTTVMTDVQARIRAISGEVGGVPVPRPPRVPTPRECAAMILKHRRDVRGLAGDDGELFGDPGWEITLAVYDAEGALDDAAMLERAGLSPTGTVGPRWIALLIQRGWIVRDAASSDGAGHLRATEKAETILSRYFARL